MKLYDNEGYLNFAEVLRHSSTFNWVIGGRGTGKTYGALKYAYENKLKFIFLRAMKSQVENIATEVFNPFKPLNDDYGYNVTVDSVIKGVQGFYDVTEERKELIGLVCALSSFTNLRGFDASDYELIIFDEFIPKDGEIVRGNWGLQFIDFYETVNRNRELTGNNPVKVFGLANSNKIGNQVFIEFELLNKAIGMIKKKQNYSKLEEKETALFFLSDSPISEKKKQTSLYKAISGGYKEMALSNAFAGVDNKNVRSLPYNQLRPLIQCKELFVYTTQDYFYLSNKGFMQMEEVNLETFKRFYNDVIIDILFERCLYENSTAKIIANEYFN